MDLDNYFNNLKELIDGRLDKYLPSEKDDPKMLHKAIRYSVFSGGKRIRPVIVIECSRVCGGSFKHVLPVASAIELVHTYSLIHDDLPSMDDDDYRRGKPSCHKAFGEANAILAGDALLTLAFNIISKNSNPRIAIAIIRRLSDAVGTYGMVGGQAIDLEFSAKGGFLPNTKNRKKNKDTLYYINRLKTSKLFEVTAEAGAIVAGAHRKKVGAMARYGEHLGLAFQIVDDIIDGERFQELCMDTSKACRDSKILIQKAKDALRIFGKRANRLKEIADYVLNRIKEPDLS